MHGGAGPLWMNVLVAAEEWGMPPWELVGGATRLTWWFRWTEYRRLQNERMKKDADTWRKI